MTSESTFPTRLTEIDHLTREDHWYLRDTDRCYFFGEYTARQGYACSPTNDLILNFKKSMDRRNKPAEWQYKNRAIERVAAAFRAALAQNFLDQVTFVPVPPSRAKGDPLYDDRLIKMLHAIRTNPVLDVREIVTQEENYEAAHDSNKRPTPKRLQEIYVVNERLIAPSPDHVAIVDDILTTGAHFRAIANILSERFPEATIMGLFIARRVLESSLT